VEQAGNSVLGSFKEQDRGSNMEEVMGGGPGVAHGLQAAMSQASQQLPDAEAAGLQEPSYQGSVMPTPSANGATPLSLFTWL